ncbi:MAG: hypothetical protein R2843_01995 [Thermomicrobiales bacterium]
MLDFAPLPSSDPRFARRDNAAPQVDLYPFGRELNGRVETGHFEADEHWESEIAYKTRTARTRHLASPGDRR